MSELRLPCSKQTEAEVLGACFSEDTGVLLNVRSLVTQEDFVLEDHKAIFAALCRRADAGDPLTVTTVWEDLQAHSKPINPGFVSDISTLADLGYAIEGNLRRLRGLTARRRLMIQASSLLQQAADLTMPVSDLVQNAVAAITSGDSGRYDSGGIEDKIAEAGGIDAFLAPKHGISTPWSGLNWATGGWQNGELALLAARPSMGKTALALNAIWHAAVRGIPSVFYSYEMSVESIYKRLICLLAEVSYQDLNGGRLDPGKRRPVANAVAEIARHPLAIVNASGRNALWLRVDIERRQRKAGLKFAVIDYIGLISTGERQQNRNQELGETCRLLKQTAGELNIPLLVLSQLNRALELRADRRPMQSDLRDSGELENHADLIAFLHRPGYYDRNNPDLRLHAELIIAKQRNGDTPTIALNFRREYGRFEQPEAEVNESCA
jgi:replicative DNA helicase